MSEDLITKLRAALGSAEHLAREAKDGEVEWIGDDAAEHGCEGSGRFIEAWRPSRVLELVGRDRALLDDYEAFGKSTEVPADVWVALRDHVRRAAEFWLGTTQ